MDEKTYHIELNTHELSIINQVLVEAPFRIVAPLIAKINNQLAQQNKNEITEEKICTE